MIDKLKINITAKINMEELKDDMESDGFMDFEYFDISATGDTVTIKNKKENGDNILKQYYLIDYITIEQSNAYFEES
jgi:hypothetical protein